MDSTRTLRISNYCLWVAVFCWPALGYWASRVTIGTVIVQEWLPGDDVTRATYTNFIDRFGDDQLLFLSWPGCDLDDPRLDRLSAELAALKTLDPALGILSVQDSRSMLRQLTEGPGGISLDLARQRLQGIAIGADGSCFIALQVADTGNAERSQLIHRLQTKAGATIGVEPHDLILAGEPYQVHIIDQASRETIQYFVAPSSAIALAVAWLCLGRVRITLLVFILAGSGQLIGLALIGIFLGQMSAVLIVLPTLVFMLTLSAAVHLTNYYRDCGGEQNPLAGAEALALGIRPCALATLTTVFGFASLAVSHLKPVWQFGTLASLGLLIATAFLLSVFPAVISLGSSRHRRLRVAPSEPLTTPFTRWLTHVTGHYASCIAISGIVALLFFSLGVVQLKTSTEFEDMFPSSSPAVASLRWLQSHVGPIDALEFLITFDKPPAVTTTNLFEDQILDRLQLITAAHRELENSVHTTSVMSAVTFLPSIPSGQGIRNTIRRAVLRRTINAHLLDLQNQHLLAEDSREQQWRLSARVRNLTGDNYRVIQRELSQVVEACLSAEFNRPIAEPPALNAQAIPTEASQPRLSITGLRTLIEKAHFALLSDLGGSFTTAFLLIAPVMMIIVRSVPGGLLLMIPNVLPVALVFGSMGWLQVKLDVASILTASVALGIAVDDTLHFVTWFARYREQGSPAAEAVRAAIANCARPMFHTTLICAGSMFPFLFGDFLPTNKFALLMILILGWAIIGDLVLLPALLQSPMGTWIEFDTKNEDN